MPVCGRSFCCVIGANSACTTEKVPVHLDVEISLVGLVLVLGLSLKNGCECIIGTGISVPGTHSSPVGRI